MHVGSDCQSEVEKLKKSFHSDGAKDCRSALERQDDERKGTPLNVAVTGKSGDGKSSFINAIRGLTADDEGAAAVDVIETTFKIAAYTHPDNPNIKFWDLPGVGTQKEYLRLISVDKYDFFVIISANRFMGTDTWLVNEISKRGK